MHNIKILKIVKKQEKILDWDVLHSYDLIRDDNGDTVVRRQYKQFGEIMKNFSAFEKELEENSKSYRIKYIECSLE